MPQAHSMVAALALGCQVAGSPQDRAADARALPGALAAVASDPAAAVDICAVLRTPAVRGDCVIHGVERLARKDPDAASALCASLSDLSADECWFQVAERSGDVHRCARAGRFAEDCRMHAWTARMPKFAGPTATAETWAARLTEATAEMGFDAEDMRPWTAASRYLLGRSLPLDRAFCDDWPAAERAVCRKGGLGLFHDRINHVRDARKWDCAGAPPALLGFAEGDSELAAVQTTRHLAGTADERMERTQHRHSESIYYFY